MNDTDMEQWMLDIMVALQPGNLEGNAKIMLNVVKAYAAEGEPVLELPRDMLCGGDCGSLADHPAFKKAVAKAEEKFLKAAAKVKNAPKIVFTKPYRPTPVAAGPDPRRPFCGRADEVFPRQVVGLARRLPAIPCTQASGCSRASTQPRQPWVSWSPVYTVAEVPGCLPMRCLPAWEVCAAFSRPELHSESLVQVRETAPHRPPLGPGPARAR